MTTEAIVTAEAPVARRHFGSQDKVRIIKQRLVERVPVSDLCDRHGIVPTLFYQWQKEFFERAGDVFERKPDKAVARLERRNAELEEKLTRKNEVLSELMEAYIAQKKTPGAL
jgi:transposase-like protein